MESAIPEDPAAEPGPNAVHGLASSALQVSESDSDASNDADTPRSWLLFLVAGIVAALVGLGLSPAPGPSDPGNLVSAISIWSDDATYPTCAVADFEGLQPYPASGDMYLFILADIPAEREVRILTETSADERTFAPALRGNKSTNPAVGLLQGPSDYCTRIRAADTAAEVGAILHNADAKGAVLAYSLDTDRLKLRVHNGSHDIFNSGILAWGEPTWSSLQATEHLVGRNFTPTNREAKWTKPTGYFVVIGPNEMAAQRTDSSSKPQSNAGMWITDPAEDFADIDWTTTNPQAEDQDAYHSFGSGIAFGLAASALIAAAQEGLASIRERRRKGRPPLSLLHIWRRLMKQFRVWLSPPFEG